MYSGYLYLGIICVVWGSTYLAMRVGVDPHNGFPVFSFGALRCLLAAGLLLSLARLNSRSLRLSRNEFVLLVLTSLGMWIGGNGLVLWAEQYVDSGFAAVIVSSSPIWVVLISALLTKTRPGVLQLICAGVGFAGVAILIFPKLQQSATSKTLGMVGLFIAPISWALCAVVLKQNTLSLSALTVSGYQHLFGGLGFAVLALFNREPMPAPTASAWGALVFLLIFGSIIGFTAFIKALEMLPANMVAMHNYVNPIIAVFLGWLLLGEPIALNIVLALVMVVIAVGGMIRAEGAWA